MKRCLLLIFFSQLFTGCIIPADVFFRNFSNHIVKLQATLINRRWFNKLPNEVSFYDTSERKRQYYGEWRAESFVTWTDTATFYIDVPAFTVINIADVSNGLAMGGKKPDVILTAMYGSQTDTLLSRDYMFVYNRFKEKRGGPFGRYVFYYDYR